MKTKHKTVGLLAIGVFCSILVSQSHAQSYTDFRLLTNDMGNQIGWFAKRQNPFTSYMRVPRMRGTSPNMGVAYAPGRGPFKARIYPRPVPQPAPVPGNDGGRNIVIINQGR